MKNLKTYLEELFATPANTMGMGNVAAPSMDNATVGSGDMPIVPKVKPIIPKVKFKPRKKKHKKTIL